MARASVRTLIPLDRVAEVLQLDPLHFNSIYSALHPEMYACDDVWFQYDWQNVGKVSRESLAFALRDAEARVTNWLGYSLLPEWVVDEPHVIDKPFNPGMVDTGLGAYGMPRTLPLDRGFVIQGGVRAATLIQAGAVIVYTDPNGDGYFEAATVSVPTTVTDPDEISIFFPGKNGDETWEIRPTTVTISGGTATIRFYRHQVPLPDLWERMSQTASELMINGDENANFLTTVDVYRVYNDSSRQLTFVASSTGNTHTGRLRLYDERRGIVSYESATWDIVAEDWTGALSNACGIADRMRISYYAGKTYDYTKHSRRRLDPEWERTMIYYALSIMDTEICGCSNFVQNAEYMRENLAESTREKRRSMSFDDLRNPFGTTRAAIELWRKVNAPGIRLFKR